MAESRESRVKCRRSMVESRESSGVNSRKGKVRVNVSSTRFFVASAILIQQMIIVFAAVSSVHKQFVDVFVSFWTLL